MNEPSNRKHGVWYWCCWAVLSLVLYPLSYGPALALICRVETPAFLWNPAITSLYVPADRYAHYGEGFLADAYAAYLEYWSPFDFGERRKLRRMLLDEHERAGG